MGTKISITTGEAPISVRVLQPGEKPHVRDVVPNSGYDFEVVGRAAIEIEGDARAFGNDADEYERQPGEPVPSDSGNQRPAPDARPDAGQTSETSGLGQDADFEAENDANEYKRSRRSRTAE